MRLFNCKRFLQAGVVWQQFEKTSPCNQTAVEYLNITTQLRTYRLVQIGCPT